MFGEAELPVLKGAQLCAEGAAGTQVSHGVVESALAHPDAYRAEVLGPPGGVRVAIEAAEGFGWGRYIAPSGGFVGMPGFGASAPAGDLYKHFGITAEAAVAAVKARL